MSKENLVRFVAAAKEDEQIRAKAQNAKNYEDFRSVAQESGFDLGDLDAAQAQQMIGEVTGQTAGELNDEQLEAVAAGITWLPMTYTSEGVSGRTGVRAVR